MKIALLSVKRSNLVSIDEAFVSFVVNWAFGNKKVPQINIFFDYLDQFLTIEEENIRQFDYFLINFGGHNFDYEDDYQRVIELQQKSSVFSEIYLILTKSLDWEKWKKAGIEVIANNSPLLWLNEQFKDI